MKKHFLSFLLFFVLLPLKIFSFDFLQRTTHLWSDSSGTSFLYDFTAQNEWKIKNNSIVALVNASYLDSSVKYFSSDIFSATVFAVYKNSFFGINTSFTSFSSSSLLVNADHAYSQNELSAFYTTVSVPIYVEDFCIKPYFNFLSCKTESGDFYWFYGKINAPYLGCYGLSLEYKNHFIDFFYAGGKSSILTDEKSGVEDLTLVSIAENIFALFYKYSWFCKNFTLKPYSGGLFFYGDFNGNLNNVNQLYALYPYKYYKIKGTANAFAILTGLNFDCKKNDFAFSLDLSSIFFAFQNAPYSCNWKYKNNLLFDGSYGSDFGDIDFLNLFGLVFLDCKADYSVLVKKVNLNFFLKKLFVLPFKILKPPSSSSFSSSSSSDFSSLALSWIFSGISCGCSISF